VSLTPKKGGRCNEVYLKLSLKSLKILFFPANLSFNLVLYSTVRMKLKSSPKAGYERGHTRIWGGGVGVEWNRRDIMTRHS
jgi:hypothetical protein